MSLTDTLKTVVPEDMATEFRRRANRAGCTVGELLRDLVCQSLQGVTFGEHVANSRRAVMGFKGPVQVHLRPASGPTIEPTRLQPACEFATQPAAHYPLT